MNDATICGVDFTAAKENGAWVAKVTATGKNLPQHYSTRPKMWDDLAWMARACGAEKFYRDCMSA
jgi:hypothetical protein